MAPITLDKNERAALNALNAVDPQAENWSAPWATGIDLEAHGADAIACTLQGSKVVFARLARRGLLDGEPGVRGHMRGYSMNDKGRQALRDQTPEGSS